MTEIPLEIDYKLKRYPSGRIEIVVTTMLNNVDKFVFNEEHWSGSEFFEFVENIKNIMYEI